MHDKRLEIDKLVRDAIRELRGGSPAPSPIAPRAERTEGVLRISDKVVSLASLNGQARSIKTLAVRGDAIVTPALRDELKHRGIALEREARHHSANGSDTTTGSAPLWLASADTDFASAEMAKILNQAGIASHVIGRESVVGAIDALAQRLASAPACAVLFTDRTAAAVCLANRRPALRAALGHSAESVNEALAEIDCNLLVISPRANSRHQLRRLLVGFARGSKGECAADLRSALEAS